MRGGMPGLSIICERFAASFRRTLSSAMRQMCEIQPVNTEVIKFSDFILQVPRPTGLFVFQLPPLPGGCAVVVDGHLLMLLVDAMCGGQEQVLDAPNRTVERDLTHIELRLLQRLAPSMGEDLTYAWEPLAAVEPEFSKIVVRPELSHLADDPESILFSVFEIQIGRFSSPLGIILPTPTIEPIKERLLRVSHVPGHVRGGKGGSRVIEHIPDIEVDFSVELGRTEIDVNTLLGLSAGDVLRLDTNADAPLRAIVEDVCKFHGQPDASGSSLVFTIHQRVE
jgi:flagellar motor switch protein FliM